MLVILSVVDFFCAIVIGLYFIMPRSIILTAALYLIIKGGFFGMSGNFLSWMDFAAGVYLVFLSFGVSYVVFTVIFVLYLIQKVAMLFFR